MSPSLTTTTAEEVVIPFGSLRLFGTLTVPDGARGVVLFAHGSGSSRLSPRNRFVADVLARAVIGSLLFDLLTDREADNRANVFDIGLLAERLRRARSWIGGRAQTAQLTIGYFGASTGAAAALLAAADAPDVSAVVSRGGRPDLAGDALARVTAPTLLIVGGADRHALELNELALAQLSCVKQLAVVPGATHLFEEPGTLEQVADLAAGWFGRYLLTAP